MISAATEMANDLGKTKSEVSRKQRITPPGIRLLEGALIAYAVFDSGCLRIFQFLLEGGSFSSAWDSGSFWFYYAVRVIGGIGVLAYVLFCQYQNPETTRLATKPGGCALRQTLRPVLETILVLWVAFAGSTFSSLHMLFNGVTIMDMPPGTSGQHDPLNILEQANGLALLAYVLYANSTRFADLGLRWTARDAAMALPLLIVAGAVYDLLVPVVLWGTTLFSGAEVMSPDLWAHAYPDPIMMVAVLRMLLNGFFEELIVRAYLMTAVHRLSGSMGLAIAVSVAVQVSYHFYQGAPVALCHVGWFLVLAVYYAKTSRILPVALAHTLENLRGLAFHAALDGV